ncbi:MAG: hypothetical protein QOF18_1799 [Frankiaceae bacterium]|nr:hypothetical protein [Frankiaceae bacterium]
MAGAAPLPNFVIVGVSKAGTTTLFNALSRHPDIHPASTKETRYFQAIRYGEPLAPLDRYRAFFRGYAGQAVTMECTPDYFYGAGPTARAIKEVCDPRVAVILRDPVTRLVSFFRFLRSRLQLPADMTLADYVDRCLGVPDDQMNRRDANIWTGVWGGHYARFLPDWQATFGDRCHLLFFDDLIAAPDAVLDRTCRWLGVAEGAITAQLDAANATVDYRSPRAQRLAAGAAKLARPVLHRFPALAQGARRAYGSVNEREAAADATAPEVVHKLREYYAESNRLLRSQLARSDARELPGWLSDRQ